MRTQDTGGIPAVPRPTAGPAGRRLLNRTVSKAWDDGIFSMAAQAAYWQTLSLPPLLLGMLGSMGYVAAWVGPEGLVTVQQNLIRLAYAVFDRDIVVTYIEPTVADILNRGRPDIISIGFPIALFAGSSAISSLVDSITFAHEQYSVRHPVWQRIFALLLYLAGLVISVATLPLLTLGPVLMDKVLPESWGSALLGAINTFYYPVVLAVIVLALTTLYKASLPRSLPWRRLLPGAVLAMVVFWISATGLRVYIAAITSTGYTYGALATPIAFLLFAFLIGFAIVLGAQLNNAIQETWPVRPSRRRHRIQRALGVRQLLEALGVARRPAPALDEPEVPATPDICTDPSAHRRGPVEAATRTDGAGPAENERSRRPQGRPPRLPSSANSARAGNRADQR